MKQLINIGLILLLVSSCKVNHNSKLNDYELNDFRTSLYERLLLPDDSVACDDDYIALALRDDVLIFDSVYNNIPMQRYHRILELNSDQKNIKLCMRLRGFPDKYIKLIKETTLAIPILYDQPDIGYDEFCEIRPSIKLSGEYLTIQLASAHLREVSESKYEGVFTRRLIFLHKYNCVTHKWELIDIWECEF